MMFCFTRSRIYTRLMSSDNFDTLKAYKVASNLSDIYDKCQYILRNPTNRKSDIDLRKELDEIRQSIEGLPEDVELLFNKYFSRLKSMVMIAILTQEYYTVIDSYFSKHPLYRILLGERTKELFIEASRTLLQFIDIQFNTLEGYPVNDHHIRFKFDRIAKAIGNRPLRGYIRLFQLYWADDTLVDYFIPSKV